jgi:hypothetical protein
VAGSIDRALVGTARGNEVAGKRRDGTKKRREQKDQTSALTTPPHDAARARALVAHSTMRLLARAPHPPRVLARARAPRPRRAAVADAVAAPTPTPRAASSSLVFPASTSSSLHRSHDRRRRARVVRARALSSRDDVFDDAAAATAPAPRPLFASAASPDDFDVDARALRALVEASPGRGRVDALARFGGAYGLATALRVRVEDGRRGGGGDDDDDARARRARFGANEVPAKPPRSFLALVSDALQVGAVSCEQRRGIFFSLNHP